MININKIAKPKYFANSGINSILNKGDSNIGVIVKSDQNKSIYDQFNNDFKMFLNKLPNNIAKNTIDDLYNRNQIYIGVPTSKSDNGLVSRAIVDDGGRCLAVVLINTELGIDVKTGNTTSIDECVYGAYRGAIRAASITQQNSIKQNKDLHKLLSTYFYLTVLKSLGKLAVYSNKQKYFLYIVCLYVYYRHYLEEHFDATKSIIKKRLDSEKLSDYYDEFEDKFELIKKYSSAKDLPKVLIDSKVIVENPNSINMIFIKNLKLAGYYSLIGPLDLLLCMAILSKYPTELYTQYAYTSDKVQNAIEQIYYKKYISSLKFDTTSLLNKR